MRTLVALLFASWFLVGCQPNVSPDSYSVGSVGQVNRVVRGKVVSVRLVDISGTHSGVGAAAGAGIGAAAGSTVGNGAQSNIAGAIGGAVLGGIIGAAAENQATKQKGWEYVIETDNGALLTIVQGGDTPLAVGQKVLVEYGQRSRVIPDMTSN